MTEAKQWSGAEVACAHELFEHWVTRTPQRIAAVRGPQELTYAELDARAELLATRLRSRGVGPDAVVGLLLDRSIELVVAVLAVWKAGGAYVPLNRSDPPGRMALALSETRARVVVTDRDPTGLLPGGGARVLRVDGLDRAAATRAHPRRTAPGTAPGLTASSGNLAYVLYTSGSTGTPKGVLVEHCGVINLAAALRLLFDDLVGARVFQFAPPTFDAWVWELAMSVLNGATLCLPPEDGALSGAALSRVLRRYRATHLSASPSLLASLPVAVPPPVRTLVAGGEVLPEFLAARWSSRVRLFNAYGPTEATVCVTAGQCSDQPGKPSIGRPLAGVEVHVVDPATGEALPVGAVGELVVGGAGVARGYLNRADLTAARFIPDRFSGRPGARLYRTGDLARWSPSGELEFVGRMDNQLNVRGFRIEPGEVEEALCRHPRVSGAVVTVDEKSNGDKRLVAHVEVRDAEPVSVPELRAFLRTTLPDHMVPSRFRMVTRLPLTAHGKVDRAALPPVDAVRPWLGHDYVAPRGTLERRLAELWARLLGLDEVGATDDFFSLGGTSLELLRLHEELAGRWALRMSIVDLAGAPTLRLLARLIEEGTASCPGEPGESAGVAGVAVRHRRIQLSQQLRSRREKG